MCGCGVLWVPCCVAAPAPRSMPRSTLSSPARRVLRSSASCPRHVSCAMCACAPSPPMSHISYVPYVTATTTATAARPAPTQPPSHGCAQPWMRPRRPHTAAAARRSPLLRSSLLLLTAGCWLLADLFASCQDSLMACGLNSPFSASGIWSAVIISDSAS